jgi:hypothetical protein
MMLSKVYGLSIQAGRSGYSIRVPIAQYMKPGEADHFAVRLMTDKSSTTDMLVDLKSIGGWVVRRTRIQLETFVPHDVDSVEKRQPVALPRLEPWQVIRPFRPSPPLPPLPEPLLAVPDNPPLAAPAGPPAQQP